MVRFFAGVAACLLMIAAAFLIWKGRAEQSGGLPPAPKFAINQAAALSAIPEAPEADAKSKEQKRFDRADKDDDGRITLAELVEPRRKPFAKLDVNGDGRLSFEEWAVKTIDKFKTADADRSAALTRAEYATTAPKPKTKKPVCDCD
jgi:hypothetical protein